MHVRVCLAAFAVASSLGCVKYQYHDPTPSGTFLPDRPGTTRARHATGVLNGKTALGRSVTVTIRGPVQVVALASATYYDENAGTHEVARLRFSDGDYFVWTDTLRPNGRFQLTSSREAWGLLSPITNANDYLGGSVPRLILVGVLLLGVGLLWRAVWSLWL